MASLDFTSYDAQLKQYFTDKVVQNLVNKNNPFLAWVPKNPNASGKSYEVPITIGSLGGASVDFAQAKAARAGSVHKRFSVTWTNNYATGELDEKTILASANDRGAFLKASVSEIENAMQVFANDTAKNLYGDGAGELGQVDSISTTTITLANSDDAYKFEVGMKLSVVSDANWPDGAARADEPTVTAVDVNTGTITVSAAGTIAADDHLTKIGGARDAGSTVTLTGLQGWLPDDADIGGSDSFFGVNRSVDKMRLGGVKYNGSGDANVRTALINGGARLFRVGGRPDAVFIHPDKFAALDVEMEGRARYDSARNMGDIGFDAIRLHTGANVVDVIADPYCPKTYAFMLQRDTWELPSLGAAPHLKERDGSVFHRLEGSDAVEFRAAGYYNLACTAPGYNAKITLP